MRLLLAAVLAGTASADRYDDNQTARAHDGWNCNRQCRWSYGFFSRSVRGSQDGTQRCACTRNGAELGLAPYRTTDHPFTGPPTVPNGLGLLDRRCCEQGDHLPWGECTEPTGRCHPNTYRNAKPFDPDYWAGNYSTDWLCVRNRSTGQLSSQRQPGPMHRACSANGSAADAACQAGKARIEASGLTVQHCGKCGACSSAADLEVLWRTRHNITALITKCSSPWVISQKTPWARTLWQLKQCLMQAGVNFSDTGQPADRASCMDVWCFVLPGRLMMGGQDG